MLLVNNIKKSFGQNLVLSDVTLDIAHGEVHGLLGANGAGKSTLSRIIAGQIRQDSGSIVLDNLAREFSRPRDSIEAGIVLVMQETSLAPDMTVLDNIFLPRFGQTGRIKSNEWKREGEAILERLGQSGNISLSQEARTLSIAQKQIVEIAKALALKARLLLLDEPTASLSPKEVERLFSIVENLKGQGCSLGFVSHRLEEVFALTDRISVLRDGRTVAAGVATADLTQSELIRLMAGEEVGRIYSSGHVPSREKGDAILTVENLASGDLVRNIKFSLHEGEILGLAGLVGSGRSETLEALFGLRQRDGGAIKLFGKPFAPRSPSDAIKQGLALVPEDRRGQSIVPDFTVLENVMLAYLGAARGFFTSYKHKQAKARNILRRLELSDQRLEDPNLLSFSGGMQQKIIMARWLLLDPKILILDEPTKGIDIKARSSIYKLLEELRKDGLSIIVVSSDFEELLGICDRVVVISDGITVSEADTSLLNEEHLTLLAAPRTSMASTQQHLTDLGSEFRCNAFWALADDHHVICLCSGGEKLPGAMQLSSGNIVSRKNSSLSGAFDQKRGSYIEAGNNRVLLVDLKTARGQSNGLAGVIFERSENLPPAELVAAKLQKGFHSERASQ